MNHPGLRSEHFDVAVVGAGIVGLAHAWMAASRGLSVVLLERTPVAVGASIRNFGMVWPIGQTAGPCHDLALRSRELWLQLAEEARVWVNPCGSLHVAHRSDEWEVLQEFVDQQRAGSAIQVELLSPSETIKRSPAIKPQGLLGSMSSSTELGVNPPQAIATIPQWLAQQHAVDCQFSTTVSSIDTTHSDYATLLASDGRRWRAERLVVCSGIDFQTLLPKTFSDAGLKICKLHMLRTIAQAGGWRLGPHLAGGLMLRNYQPFAACPSLAKLQDRVRQETPELDEYGIHVMASQNELGQVILGDSHEYDSAISPFDRSEIDALILRELHQQFNLPDWTIESRWHGTYAKHPTQIMLESEPHERLHVCVAPGGAGMTLAFGIADRFWKKATQ